MGWRPPCWGVQVWAPTTHQLNDLTGNLSSLNFCFLPWETKTTITTSQGGCKDFMGYYIYCTWARRSAHGKPLIVALLSSRSSGQTWHIQVSFKAAPCWLSPPVGKGSPRTINDFSFQPGLQQGRNEEVVLLLVDVEEGGQETYAHWVWEKWEGISCFVRITIQA